MEPDEQTRLRTETSSARESQVSNAKERNGVAGRTSVATRWKLPVKQHMLKSSERVKTVSETTSAALKAAPVTSAAYRQAHIRSLPLDSAPSPHPLASHISPLSLDCTPTPTPS